MQVTLNIEAGQLGETVLDLFKNLSDGKKEELAVQIMSNWLGESHGSERQVYESILIEKYRSGQAGDKSRNYKDMSDEGIRNDYYFRQSMEKYKSSREIMVEMITEATQKAFQKHVDELVQKDPQMTKIRETLVDMLKTSYPEMLLHSVTASITTALSMQLSQAVMQSYQVMNHEALLQNVRQRLQI